MCGYIVSGVHLEMFHCDINFCLYIYSYKFIVFEKNIMQGSFQIQLDINSISKLICQEDFKIYAIFSPPFPLLCLT